MKKFIFITLFLSLLLGSTPQREHIYRRTDTLKEAFVTKENANYTAYVDALTDGTMDVFCSTISANILYSKSRKKVLRAESFALTCEIITDNYVSYNQQVTLNGSSHVFYTVGLHFPNGSTITTVNVKQAISTANYAEFQLNSLDISTTLNRNTIYTYGDGLVSANVSSSNRNSESLDVGVTVNNLTTMYWASIQGTSTGNWTQLMSGFRVTINYTVDKFLSSDDSYSALVEGVTPTISYVFVSGDIIRSTTVNANDQVCVDMVNTTYNWNVNSIYLDNNIDSQASGNYSYYSVTPFDMITMGVSEDVGVVLYRILDSSSPYGYKFTQTDYFDTKVKIELPDKVKVYTVSMNVDMDDILFNNIKVDQKATPNISIDKVDAPIVITLNASDTFNGACIQFQYEDYIY